MAARLFAFAKIGDVKQIYPNDTIPDGWHLMDGSVYRVEEWPQYAEAMGLQPGVFKIPKPERLRAGSRFIIRLGERRSS